jgi:MFS family permease
MTGPSREDLRPFATLPRNIAPLGYRNYALFWAGFMATNAGRWIELAGTVWLVYELTKSPFLLGLLGIARALPTILLSPIGGVVADRVDQKRVLSITQTLGFLASLALAIVVVTGQVQLWHIYVQVAVQATITAFDASVRHALFPRLVPKSAIPEAVALSVVAGRFSKMVGPAVGGISIATLGEAAPFFLNAASFLVLIAAVSFMTAVKPRTRVEGSTFRGDLRAGFGYMLGQPVIRGLLTLELVFGVFQLNPAIITLIGRQLLDVDAVGLGGLLSAPALGATLGLLGVIAFGQSRRAGRFVILCTVAYAAGIAVLALPLSYLATFGVLFSVGLVDSLVAVTRQSVMQVTVPGKMRGRIMANVGSVTRGTTPLAEAQSGLIAGLVGPSMAVIAAAGVLVANAVSTRLTNPALWAFVRDDAGTTPPGPRSELVAAGPELGDA